jgi:hypothetical protein
MGSITAQLRKKRAVNVGASGANQSHAFYPFVTGCSDFKVGADILDRCEMIIVIL